MKKTLSCIVALLVCLPVFANKFQVKLDLKGITSDKIYITVFGDREHLTIDTPEEYNGINRSSDGTFLIKGETDGQGLLRIHFKDDRQLLKATQRGHFPVKCAYLWVVVSPDSKLTVKGDLTGKNFVDLYPRADAENSCLSLLMGKLMPLTSRGGDIAVILAEDPSLTAAEKAELEKESEDLEQRMAGIRNDFVREHPSSIAGLWLMEDMLIRSQTEPEELEPLMEKVEAKYHENYFYKAVASRLQGARNAAVGAKCPVVEGMDQNGKTFNIKEIKGKYIIIDFWGTWCGACLAGMPHMKEFRDSHSDKVEILGIANDKDVAKWKKCIQDKGMDWFHIIQGSGDKDFVAKFNVQGFPTKILVSPDGKILYRESGESPEFYQNIEKLINR